MGQRTAIVLRHENNYLRKFTNVKTSTTRVFYHQWGIGRILPSQLMAILNGTLSDDPKETYFPLRICPPGCIDVTHDYERGENILDEVDFDKPEIVGEIIQEADNNNGGIFIKITITEEGEKIIEYAYMLGSLHGNYDKFCTFEEWMKYEGKGYIDKKFLTLYNKTINYFKAKEYNPNSTTDEK